MQVRVLIDQETIDQGIESLYYWSIIRHSNFLVGISKQQMHCWSCIFSFHIKNKLRTFKKILPQIYNKLLYDKLKDI